MKSKEAMLIKKYEAVPDRELPSLPVHAIQGVSAGDEKLLTEAFHIKTVGDLARLKYVNWAQEICEAAEEQPNATADFFRDKLVKKYETKKLSSLPKAPVDALQGLSKGDAERLKKAFHVKTIRDLAEQKYAAYARDLVAMSIRSASMPAAEPYLQQRSLKWFWVLLVLVLGAIALLYWQQNKGNKQTAVSVEPEPANVANAEAVETPATQTDDIASPDTKTEPDNKPADLKTEPVRRTAGEKEYIVESGDTLASISLKLYGNYSRSQEIYRLNRRGISNANRIFPGQILRLP